MNRRSRTRAFTLIELTIVVAIIALLVTTLVPSLTRWIETAKCARCLSGLRHIGAGIIGHQSDHGQQFVPYVHYNMPRPGVWTYYWGTKTNPVDHKPSRLMKYIEPDSLLCPSLNWDDLVPQGGVIEPTTTYGYNARALDPNFLRRFGADAVVPCTKSYVIKKPVDLFVFADSAMCWSPGSVTIFQNSSYLEPPAPGPRAFVTPTNHFRHNGRSNALCADGHVDSFAPGDGGLIDARNRLGFVGTTNDPHYDN